MEKPSINEFHRAMYSKYPGISFETALELYLEQYPEKKESDPEATETEKKPKKKSKK